MSQVCCVCICADSAVRIWYMCRQGSLVVFVIQAVCVGWWGGIGKWQLCGLVVGPGGHVGGAGRRVFEKSVADQDDAE